MTKVSSDAKNVKVAFNYRQPGTLIEAFELLLKQHDAKAAEGVAWEMGKVAKANDALVRYYHALSLERLSEMALARKEALVLAMLAEGVTNSDTPELGEQGSIKIPRAFFDRFPDARALFKQFVQHVGDLHARFKPKFTLGGGDRALGDGLSNRVLLGDERGRFDYWPVTFARKRGKNDEIHELDRGSVAALLIDDIVARVLPPNFRKRSRRRDMVATFGSCFALNLARSLEGHNIRSQSFRIEEVVNTTRANRLLLEYVLLQREPDTNFFSKTISPTQCEEIRGAVRNASVIVLTVGVSPVTEWKATGKLCLSNKYKELFARDEVIQRFTTVEENRDNIVAIVDMIKDTNRAGEIFVTLSPVPLLGVADGSSVVTRDLISKSTLRLAIEEAAKQCKFIYWPSFEVVKWIAPHVGGELNYQAYAEDDKNSRHVSKWLIDIITSKFIEYTFEPEGQTGS